MIQEVKMFTIVCDNCKDKFINGDIKAWNKQSDAKISAYSSNWINENGFHYCPECYRFDDNDKLIIKKLNMEAIDAACKLFNVSEDDLMGNKVRIPIPQARHCIMWYHRVKKKESLRDAGMMVNKDHVSVFYALKKIGHYCETDKEYRDKFNEFKRMMS